MRKKIQRRKHRAKQGKKLFITRNLTASRNERPHFGFSGLRLRKGDEGTQGEPEQREWRMRENAARRGDSEPVVGVKVKRLSARA